MRGFALAGLYNQGYILNQIDPKYLPLVVAAVSVVGILVTAATAIGIHLHNGRVAKRQRLLDACVRFRSAFAEVRARADDGSIRVSWISQCIGAQESAIVEFRTHLKDPNLTGFDAACQVYRRRCKPAFDPTIEDGRLGLGPRPDGGYSLEEFPRALADTFTRQQRNDLLRAIDIMLAYAGKT